MQCLTYTEPLAAYLQDVGHGRRCKLLLRCFAGLVKSYTIVKTFVVGHMAGFCALCAMQKHVRLALQASGKIVAPKYLVSNLRCNASQNLACLNY